LPVILRTGEVNHFDLPIRVSLLESFFHLHCCHTESSIAAEWKLAIAVI
jgi:hypothetical protein